MVTIPNSQTRMLGSEMRNGLSESTEAGRARMGPELGLADQSQAARDCLPAIVRHWLLPTTTGNKPTGPIPASVTVPGMERALTPSAWMNGCLDERLGGASARR